MTSDAECISCTMGNHDLNLQVPSDVFKPNTTTRLLASHLDTCAGRSVLDLGCGVGPLAIVAALNGANNVMAVDIMESACEAARANSVSHGVGDRVTVQQSDLFGSLNGEAFDLIVNDVSGMAEEVARISPWFPNAVPTGGADGAEITVRMLHEARQYLKPGGELLFPVLSLAAGDRILAAAREVFGDNLESIAEKRIPFCQELLDNMDILERLSDEGIISFEELRSRYVWRLWVYRAEA